MILCRLYLAFVAMLVFAIGMSVYAAGDDHIWDIVQIRENGVDYDMYVAIPLVANPSTEDDFATIRTLYEDGNCNDPSHRTSYGNSFKHGHVYYSFPIEGIVVGSNPAIRKTVTADNVRSHWDHWFAVDSTIGHRENVVSFGAYYDEDPTHNCWGYSFERDDIWIDNPNPIYEDDYNPIPKYSTLEYPVVGDIIRIDGHVVTTTSIVFWALPHYPYAIVVGTREKMRHSGIYYFLYDLSTTGFFHYGAGDYYRKK